MVKILVVDDEEDLELLVNQKFYSKIKDKVYEFIFARNGVEGLEKVKEHPDLDIVLSDINMPVMDGLTLLSRLAETNPMLKAVVVSAYDDMQSIRLAMNRGAFDFIVKPVDFLDLDLTIEKTIQHVKQLKHIRHLTATLNTIAYQQSHLIRRPLANVIGLVQILDELALKDEGLKSIVIMLRQSCNDLNDEFEIFMTKGIPDENAQYNSFLH
jgi:YesN/AraC family two-component response regulator